jgi:type IV secretion system protein VirD4
VPAREPRPVMRFGTFSMASRDERDYGRGQRAPMTSRSRSPLREAAQGPFLGWLKGGPTGRAIGFRPAQLECTTAEPIYGAATEHQLVLGPTGSWKTRSVVIPGVLEHSGPMVVVDVKGELFRATRRHSAQGGRRVKLLDPFGVLKGHKAVGLDLLQPVVEADDPAAAARSIVEGFSPTDVGRDPFWSSSGNSLLASTLHYAATLRGRSGDGPRSFCECIDLLTGDDVAYSIARLLDTDPAIPAESRRGFTTFLQMPDVTRGGVLASAQAPLRLLSSKGLRRSLSGHEIDLAMLTRGDNIAIYVAWPPTALKSHGQALRLILSLFLDAVFRRASPPTMTTLFMVDEAGTIGPVPQIETAFTLARGYGCRVAAVFQSIHQIEACYGTAGRTVFDNAGTITVLPPSNPRSAQEIAGLLGLEATSLSELGVDEALVARRGQPPQIVRRPDYLTDCRYAGKWDDSRATPKCLHLSAGRASKARRASEQQKGA